MKYQKGIEVICIRTLKRKDDGQINFIIIDFIECTLIFPIILNNSKNII